MKRKVGDIKTKQTMNKKFKNGLLIRGPQSLLKAFGEELNILGYNTEDVLKSEDSVIVTYLDEDNDTYIYSSEKNVSWTKNGTTGALRLIYNLPQDWNIALEKAAEVEEPEEELIIGKYYWYEYNNDGNKRMFRLTKMDVSIYGVEINGFNFNNEDKWTSIKKEERRCTITPCTPKDIEEYLIKEAGLRGFKSECKGIGVRDIEKTDVWTINGTTGKGVENKAENFRFGKYFFYNSKTDTLFNWGFGLGIVYEKGVWATLKPTHPEITLAGYKGEFLEEGVKFGCAFISKYDFIDWSKDKNLFAVRDSTSIKIEGIKISKDQYSDILTLDHIKEIVNYYDKK